MKRDILPVIAILGLAGCAADQGKPATGSAPPQTSPAPATNPAPAATEPAGKAPVASLPTAGGPSVEPPEGAAPAEQPARAAFTDAGSVDRWMISYYKHPELDRFVEAFRALDASGAFAIESKAWGYSAFFAELMRPNPGTVPMWCDELGAVKEPAKMWWWTAVWHAETEPGAQAIKEARALPAGHERRIDYRWLDEKHRDILKTPIRGSQQIDMLWHAFGASGDELFVLKQFEGLVEFPVR